MKGIAGLVARVVADAQAAGQTQTPARRPGFDNDYLWRWLAGVPAEERTGLMRAAAWLYKTGVMDTQAVVWLLEEGRAVGVRNWYAYYARGREARRAALGRFQRGSAARERKETEQWLKSRGGA